MDEKTLIYRLKNGEDAAFRVLYEQHYSVLCHYAATILKDSYVSESIVGDCIFKIWQNRQTLTISTSLRAYLMASVRNRCLNYIRDTSRTGYSSSLPLEAIKEMSFEANGNPLGKLLEDELEDVIIQAVETLPDKTREVFELSRVGNKSYLEISNRLQISVNTVKYHMKQALALLNHRLSPYLKVNPGVGKRH